MVYEVNAYCKEHEYLTDWVGSRYFKFCPECGKKVKIIAHCLECGKEGSEDEIHNHKCKKRKSKLF